MSGRVAGGRHGNLEEAVIQVGRGRGNGERH